MAVIDAPLEVRVSTVAGFDAPFRWAREELESGLAGPGFGEVAYFGAYDAAVDVRGTDRLVAVAQLSRAAA